MTDDLGNLGDEPDTSLARWKYHHHAPGYDVYSAAAEALRITAVSRMPRRPGGTVLDIGCGTGLNFRALRGVVGETGRVVGVDPSPAMLTKASDRIAREGWSNVELREGCVEDVELPDGSAGALICLVHDVMRSPESLKHIVAHVAPGGTVVAAGAKLVPPETWWAPALNYLVLEVNRPYITSAEGLDRPWNHLAALLPGLNVELDPWGVTYSAVGTVPGESG